MMRRAAWLLLLLVLLMIPSGAMARQVYESNMILVNKEWGLPYDYVPSD